MDKSIYTVLWAGSLAGVLDITAALVLAGTRAIAPTRVLQFIASGVLGARSFRGGTGTAVLGGALHFLIAFTAAGIYYAASRKLTFLTSQPVIAGLLYGAVVYVFMNAVALPLSAAAKRPISAPEIIIQALILCFMVGLPISLVVSRSSQ